MPNLRSSSKGDSNTGSLDLESGILPLFYRALQADCIVLYVTIGESGYTYLSVVRGVCDMPIQLPGAASRQPCNRGWRGWRATPRAGLVSLPPESG